MLSRPPAALAAAISSGPSTSSGFGGPVSSGSSLRLADHRRQAVRAEQEDVAGARVVGLDVDLDARLGPERAGDDRALRVRLGLLLGELPAPHQLVDERVVVGQPRELAVAQQVGARVADVRDGDRRSRRRRRPSPSCPCRRAGARSASGRGWRRWRTRSAATRPSAAESPSGSPSSEGRDGHLRGDLARLRAAHAVGDDEQRGADEEVVLVPLRWRPRSESAHCSAIRSMSLSLEAELGVADADPSPACRGCGPRSGSPFK